MRKINELTPIPDELHFYSLANFSNRLNNKKTINSLPNTRVNLSFPGYENEKYKNLIRKLADGCCSYCGMRIGTYTITVEHFRPKKRLDFLKQDCFKKQFLDCKKTFSQENQTFNYGYFLWGDDSRNLLPSCGACNTGQSSNGVYVNNTIKYNIPYGKKNFFPILVKNYNNDPRKSLFYINNIINEKSLLFNPFYDNPEDLFIYKEYKQPYCHVKIKVNPSATKFNKLKAMTTINLLGLNRRYLCDERFKILNGFRLLLKSFLEALKNKKNEIFWKDLVYQYVSFFNENSSSLLGYAAYIDKKTQIGNKIEEYLLEEFSPRGILQTHTSEDLINQLKKYAEKMDDSIDFLVQNIDSL